jgi:O-antigen/teichoic acid export membrane protein
MRHFMRMGFRGTALGRSYGAPPGARPSAPPETGGVSDSLEPSSVPGERRLRRLSSIRARAGMRNGSLSLAMNGLALSAGTMLRLAIGFLTWLVAARLYSTSQVGTAAAAISAMLLCVQIGTLGVDLAIIALYPRHRDNPARLLDTGITLGTATALLSGVGFVALAAAGLHSLHVLVAEPLYTCLFLVLTVLGASWWIMDQTSVALRRSDQVLLRAIVAAGITLTGVAVFGLAGWDTAAAILTSWVLAAFVACAVGGLQIARVLRPYRIRPRLAQRLVGTLITVGLPNFAMTAADNAPGFILPIVAAQVLSARSAAVWYVVWMMSLAAYTIPFAFGLNLFAEAAGAPSRLAHHVRDGFRVAIPLASAATIALAVLGPFVLSFLGSPYGRQGGTPVRIMALAAVPMVVTKIYLAVCRATGRLREGTIVAAIAGVTAVTTGVIAASHIGLTGIAVAWLAVQVVTAVATGLRLRTLLPRASSSREVTEPTEGVGPPSHTAGTI